MSCRCINNCFFPSLVWRNLTGLRTSLISEPPVTFSWNTNFECDPTSVVNIINALLSKWERTFASKSIMLGCPHNKRG